MGLCQTPPPLLDHIRARAGESLSHHSAGIPGKLLQPWSDPQDLRLQASLWPRAWWRRPGRQQRAAKPSGRPACRASWCPISLQPEWPGQSGLLPNKAWAAGPGQAQALAAWRGSKPAGPSPPPALSCPRSQRALPAAPAALKTAHQGLFSIPWERNLHLEPMECSIWNLQKVPFRILTEAERERDSGNYC